MNWHWFRRVAEIVIANHPPICEFTQDAADRIADKAFLVKNSWHSEGEMLDWFEQAIKDQELYCPHEGIDRRR